MELCKYDDPAWERRHDMEIRNGEVARQFEAGIEVKQIAKNIGISARTVYRVLQIRREGIPETVVKNGPGQPSMSLEDLAKWRPSTIYGKLEDRSY